MKDIKQLKTVRGLANEAFKDAAKWDCLNLLSALFAFFAVK
jgi:hypothetical protein